MSYTIEYNKQIFYIEEGGEKTYFLFIRQGDNNVRNVEDNLRSKKWYLFAKGTEKELWKKIGKRLSSVEGGGIQKAKGWEETEYFTLEEYIKQYRSKIKNAKPLDVMLDSFQIEAYIYIREEFKLVEDKVKEAVLRNLIEKYDMRHSGTYYYDKSKIKYTLLLTDFEILKDFFLNMSTDWTEDYDTGFDLEKKVRRKA